MPDCVTKMMPVDKVMRTSNDRSAVTSAIPASFFFLIASIESLIENISFIVPCPLIVSSCHRAIGPSGHLVIFQQPRSYDPGDRGRPVGRDCTRLGMFWARSNPASTFRSDTIKEEVFER